MTEEPKEPELEPEPEKQPSPPPKGAAPEFVEVYQDQVRDLKHGSKSVSFCYFFLSLKKSTIIIVHDVSYSLCCVFQSRKYTGIAFYGA